MVKMEDNMLDIRVGTFLAVCRHMNYTKAAEELNLTQPAVSQHIKYLEEYYNARLFSFSGRKLSLTEQGTYLKNAFEAFYHDAARIKEDISRIHGRQILRIGATLSIGEFYLPERISGFMSERPELDLSLTVADTKVLLGMLDGGELDFVLCEGYFSKSDYAFRLIRNEPVCCLCSPEYPIGTVKGIEDLFSHRLIIREQGSGTREILERNLSEKGYSVECFTSRWDISSPHVILRLLTDCQGITFLYRTAAEKLLSEKKLIAVPVPDFDMAHEFNAIWKPDSLFDSYYSAAAASLCD